MDTVSKTLLWSKNLDETIGLSDGTVSKTAAVSKNLDESIGRQCYRYTVIQRHH